MLVNINSSSAGSNIIQRRSLLLYLTMVVEYLTTKDTTLEIVVAQPDCTVSLIVGYYYHKILTIFRPVEITTLFVYFFASSSSTTAANNLCVSLFLFIYFFSSVTVMLALKSLPCVRNEKNLLIHKFMGQVIRGLQGCCFAKGFCCAIVALYYPLKRINIGVVVVRLQ